MKEYIDKQEARQLMKNYRKMLGVGERAEFCSEICRNFMSSGIVSDNTRCILSFASYGTEPDTGMLHHSIRLQYPDICVAYPKVCGDMVNMDFYRVDNYSDMAPGYMNIPEPDGDRDMVIPGIHDEIVMIVPGLAFDMDGARAGYGGGFYDRYLERYPGITKAAICYDGQLFNERLIDRAEHDILMDYIVTDKKVVKVKEEC